MSSPATSLPPGFRFHPTDEELILHYLRNRAASSPCPVSIIAEVDIYKFDPWELPAKATFGDREWYFFSPRDRKYPNGIRPNRAAASGYWKATGTDKPIHTSSGNENIGVKKALVFYKGRPPKGLKTSWIMHEYRLAEAQTNNNSYRPMKLRDSSMRLDDWVLCRIYKKTSHPSSVAPPQMDQEQEDSGSEDVYFSTMPNSVMQPQNIQNLHKSSSLSEFLNLLFDNPSEVLGTEHVPLTGYSSLNQPLIHISSSSSNNNNGRNYSSHQFSHTESPASFAENSPKRQRPVEGCSGEGSGQPAKRHNSSCILPSFTSQFDSSQYSSLNQPLFNLQIPLNSYMGLH